MRSGVGVFINFGVGSGLEFFFFGSVQPGGGGIKVGWGWLLGGKVAMYPYGCAWATQVRELPYLTIRSAYFFSFSSVRLVGMDHCYRG